jgi:ATP-dependent DNA ligase
MQRTLPAGFIAPCLPTKTDKLPSGSQWLHEIKHDGFRIIARKKGSQVRLYSRPGNDLTHRFPLIGREGRNRPLDLPGVVNVDGANSIATEGDAD